MSFSDWLGETWGSVSEFARGYWNRVAANATGPGLQPSQQFMVGSQVERKLALDNYALASAAPWERDGDESWWKTGLSYADFVLTNEGGVPRAAMAGSSFLYKEAVSQPGATLGLMLADAGDEGFASLFDGDAWSRTYGEADFVSPGQAMVFAGGQLLPGDEFDKYDPRKDQRVWKTNGWLRMTSGTFDFAANLFLDPTVIAGKGAKVGKLYGLSRPFTGDAVAKGQKYVGSRRFARFADHLAKAESPTEISQRYLKDHPFGGVLATALWDVRTDREAVGLVIRSSLGDDLAWRQLTKDAPRIAERIARQRGWFDISKLSRRQQNLSDEEWGRLEAARETSIQAFADAIQNGKGVWGQVQSPLLVGQKQPRVSATGTLRWGVHQATRWDAPKTVLPLARKFMPSAKIVRALDLNDPDSHGNFLAWLERTELPRDQVEKFHAAYMSKTSPEFRYSVAQKAEEATFTALAGKHGMSEAEVNEILPEINAWKGKAYRFVKSRPAYISDELRERVKARSTRAAPEGEGDAAELAAQIEQGFLSTLDADGNLVLREFNTESPITRTQSADYLPMVDMRDIDVALRQWRTWSPGYKALATVTTATDAAMRAWKTAVLLRLGYPVRAISDETLRDAALHGITPWLMGAAAGTGRTLNNMAVRAAAGGRRALGHVSRRKSLVDEGIQSGRRDAAELVMPASGKKVYRTPPTGRDVTYASMDEAVARGAVSGSEYTEWARANWQDLGPQDKAVVKAWRDGIFDAGRAKYLLTRRAMAQHGRDRFYRPEFQRAVLDDAAGGDFGGGFMVDPATGKRRDLEPENWSTSRTVHLTPGEDGRFDIDNLHDYIVREFDELNRPDRLLSVSKAPNSQIRLAVAEPAKELDEPLIPDAAPERVEFLGGLLRIRESGVRDIRVKGEYGTYSIEGAFAGPAGALKRDQASSRGDANLWEHLVDTEYGRLVDRTANWSGSITPDSAGYDAAWTRAAVHQLGQDAMAKQFLQGRSLDDVVAWLEDNPRGRAYLGARPDRASRYREWAETVELWTDTYVPDVGDLRKRVLNGTATGRDLRGLVPDKELPMVHGQTIEEITTGHPALKWARGKVQKAMHTLGQVAPDKAARWPAFDKAYRKNLEVLLKAREKHLGDRVSVDEIDRVRKVAHQQALHDVRKWLYDTSAEYDAAHFIRNIVPFPNAVLDAFHKWTKIAVQEDPSVAARVWQLWSAPERHGLIVDGQGRELDPDDHGNERWFEVDPATGKRRQVSGPDVGKDRYIRFIAPSWAVGNAYGEGVSAPVDIPKATFNTILNQPGAGPLVQVAANELTLRDPSLWDNRIVRNFVLPYGPDAGETGEKTLGLYQGTFKKVLPTSVQRIIDVLNNSDEGRGTEYLTMSIMQYEQHRYSIGERDTKPTVKEARERARDLKLVRLGAALTSPVALVPHSPLQPYIDAHRQLQARDPLNADRIFYEQHGDELFWVVGRTTKNLAGMLASTSSYKQYREYEDLIRQHPEEAGLIVGAEGAGSFNKAVYEWQKTVSLRDGSNRRLRQVLSLAESMDDVQKRLGWLKFQKVQDQVDYELEARGLTSLRQKGAEDLKVMRDSFIEANKYRTNDAGQVVGTSAWYDDYASMDRAATERRLIALRNIAVNGHLANRMDIEGLREYLWSRAQTKAELAAGEFKTLRAQGNTLVAQQWDGFVSDLKLRNPAFADLHTRWLSGDEDLVAD